MKKIILYIFPLVAIFVLFGVYTSLNQNPTEVVNTKKEPLSFKDNKIVCPQCNMFLVGKKYTAQAITSDRKTHFFDDVGCMILWLEENAKDDKEVVEWVYSLDTKKWVNAVDAFYSINDKNSPMHYGFGAYENSKKEYIPYEQMKLRMLRGENLLNPKIRKKILG
ncbi:hypothetical protein [Sulfurospirillum arcachonense]|uniref:hypothetical protein n=1 Tax=Sulfurospirillum arcachonense TaxID=57666 RepID=UPI000469F062|nr:hypothetical protein [Sulfurospirillum arcachonense]